ncbi:hypothetical protein [Rubrimonas cliftonensis]|uniref:Uncharacterized protein n=1 Tax=Rubrimonas cliftonensis TaxID=89524 RepID=A0A1H3YAI7_9RHOB|nr:hypothetical protein [Rubrimonas cliftonensis]SEA08629.1 hypothetical protein SAMN05444370_10317 [Rubrimonas cliftonensis]
MLSLAAGCGEDIDENPRVKRLESELELALERSESLERRLAESTSRAGETEALREQLVASQARVEELETPAGMAEATREVENLAETRRLLVEAVSALRTLDRSLERSAATAAPEASDAPAQRPDADMRAEIDRAAEAITGAAGTLGLEISGLPR